MPSVINAVISRQDLADGLSSNGTTGLSNFMTTFSALSLPAFFVLSGV
jgi:hypothetical protein